MSGSISIVSDANIAVEEFENFLRSMGAVTNPDDVFVGQLSERDSNIWIALAPDEPMDDSVAFAIARELGATPRTSIVLEIGNGSDSWQLAMGFVCTFAARWRCVVYDLIDKVYSPNTVREICKTGGTFDGSGAG